MKAYGNFLRVSKIPKDFPFSKSTLYLWASTGRYPGLFKRIGKTLFIDTEVFEGLFLEKKTQEKEKQ